MWRLIGKDIHLLRSTLWTQVGVIVLVVGAALLLREPMISFYALVLLSTYSLLILPLLTIGLMSLHFWRVRKDGGISTPVYEEDE